MDGHQLDLVRLLAVVSVGVQRDVLQVVVQGSRVPLHVFLLVDADGVHQLGDVLQPLFVIIVAVFHLQARLFKNMLQHPADAPGEDTATAFLDEVDEPVQGGPVQFGGIQVVLQR